LDLSPYFSHYYFILIQDSHTSITSYVFNPSLWAWINPGFGVLSEWKPDDISEIIQGMVLKDIKIAHLVLDMDQITAFRATSSPQILAFILSEPIPTEPIPQYRPSGILSATELNLRYRSK
jgi:hypothetical protein